MHVYKLMHAFLLIIYGLWSFFQYHWERRIAQLGGPNYSRYGPKMFDNEGKEVPGTRGKIK